VEFAAKKPTCCFPKRTLHVWKNAAITKTLLRVLMRRVTLCFGIAKVTAYSITQQREDAMFTRLDLLDVVSTLSYSTRKMVWLLILFVTRKIQLLKTKKCAEANAWLNFWKKSTLKPKLVILSRPVFL
jgi:hypothetical protein